MKADRIIMDVVGEPPRRPRPSPYPLLIGLYSPAPQMGKSMTAGFLETMFGFTRVRFADRMKHDVRGVLHALGYGGNSVEQMVEGSLKLEPVPEFDGKTTRDFMVHRGMTGRDFQHDLWVRIGMGSARRALNNGEHVAMEDVRFENEAAAIHAAGGLVIRVHRPGVPIIPSASEALLEGFPFDAAIENDGTPRSLQASVRSLVEAFLLKAHVRGLVG